MPEIVLFALLIAVLLADLWVSDENRYLTHLMSLGTVIIVAVTQLAVWEQGSTLAFHGMYIDGMSRLSKLVLYGLTFGLFIYVNRTIRRAVFLKASFILYRCLPC